MSEQNHDFQSAEAPPAPEHVWSSLRAAREEKGLSLSQVSAHLKLTVRQIEAIERGDLSELPGATFARGFVRNYARFMGLDPALFVLASDEKAVPAQADIPRQMISPNLGRMPSASNPRYSALPAALLVLLLTAVLGAGWHYGWFESRDEMVLLSSDIAIPAASVPETVAGAVLAESSVPAVEASPVVAQLAVAMSEPAQSASAAQEPARPVPVAVSVTPAASADLPRMVFSFEGDSWVEVRDAAGQIVFSRLNQAGSVQEVQGTPPFALVIGNAAHVKLSWKGQPVDLVSVTKGNVAYPNLK